MPLYEYRCNACSETFDLLRPAAQREVAAVCPACESSTSMPLISRISALSGARSDGTAGLPSPGPAPAGGGPCCGGGCGFS